MTLVRGYHPAHRRLGSVAIPTVWHGGQHDRPNARSGNLPPTLTKSCSRAKFPTVSAGRVSAGTRDLQKLS